MDFLTIIILILTGFFSSFYGVVAGGGTMLVFPVLLFLGLPPSVAVATDRFGALGGELIGFYKFSKARKVAYKLVLPLTILAVIGSFIGANILVSVDENLLQKILAIFLISVALLLIFKKETGIEGKISRLSGKRKVLGYFLSFLIGIYVGFFGAGWATIFSYLLILLFGLTFLESAGTRLFAGIFITIIAVIIFIVNGRVEFLYGGILLISKMMGGYLGASLAIKRGENFAKILFIAVAIISGIKLLI